MAGHKKLSRPGRQPGQHAGSVWRKNGRLLSSRWSTEP